MAIQRIAPDRPVAPAPARALNALCLAVPTHVGVNRFDTQEH